MLRQFVKRGLELFQSAALAERRMRQQTKRISISVQIYDALFRASSPVPRGFLPVFEFVTLLGERQSRLTATECAVMLL